MHEDESDDEGYYLRVVVMSEIKSIVSRPPLQTNAPAQKHPSLGGSKGYSQDARLTAVNQYRNGTFVAGGVGTPSLSSIRR